jgi:hypothetical protein
MDRDGVVKAVLYVKVPVTSLLVENPKRAVALTKLLAGIVSPLSSAA